jgi:CelD/BcsL family acetyltransferase involved in cellulose biosynthesis
MKVDALPGFAGLDERRWNGLLDQSKLPSVFLTWQWQTEWARSFAAGPLQLLTVTDEEGSLSGLLPLYEESPGRLRILGGVDVSDYLDVLTAAGREEEVWQTLLQHRAAQPVEWDLHAIRAVSPTLALVPALAPSSGLRVLTAREERCPVLRLPETWDDYLARLAGKDRHELRRKMRKPSANCRVLRAPCRARRLGPALGNFLALHRRSKVGKARFMDERMERFFHDATLALARAGWARLWFLESAGVAVASFLCVEYAGRGTLQPGFDPAHSRPRSARLAHVIGDAITRGIPTFDFLRGEEPYKLGFGPVLEDLFSVRIGP